MPMAVQFMADAVAGGDVGKLSKMMEKGEVDPIKALPKFFAALKAQATPFLNDFYNTIEYRRGRIQKANEDWMKAFMGAGGDKGMAGIFQTWEQIVRDSIPQAEKLGKIFKIAADYLSAAFLAPGEILDWFKGGKNNFMQTIFGDVEDSAFATKLKTMFETIGESFSKTISKMDGDLGFVISSLSIVARIVSNIFSVVIAGLRLLDAFDSGGFAGAKHELVRGSMESNFREQAIRDLKASGMPYDESDINSVTKAYLMDWDSKNPAPVIENKERGSRALFGYSMTEGLDEVSGLLGSGNFSWGALWDVLNKDRSHLINAPSNSPSLTGGLGSMSGTIYVHQSPLIIDARVEGTTAPEVLESSVNKALNDREEKINRQLMNRSGMIPQ